MATLQDQLAALKAARGSGELRVTYNGKTVEYRSIDELTKAIAAVQGEIDAESSTPTFRSSVAYFDRGFS